MTGSHVGATRNSYSLTKVAAGHDIGVSFLLVHFLWTSKENEPACRRGSLQTKLLLIQPLQNLILHLRPYPILNTRIVL